MYKTKRHTRTGKYSKRDLLVDLKRIQSAFAQTAGHVKDKTGSLISDTYDNAVERTVDFKDNAIQYAKRKPLKTVGFAMLAGLAIGIILNRK
jgi:ElaB/YqjD/DUF883 family membrane-anchored ribosome-binding protein